MKRKELAVLVVDDDTAIRETLVTLFREESYLTFEAPDGMSALECLRTSLHRLVVLLDWRMPGLDGIQVLEALADDAPIARRHAFIMMTAEADEPPLDVARVPPGLRVDVFKKPFDFDELLQAVEDKGRALAAT